MKSFRRYVVVLAMLVCLPFASCHKAQVSEGDEEKETKPATVEKDLPGPEPTRVTLTQEAAKRLDVQTAPVADAQVGGQQRSVIPYSAVLYDVNGAAWTWINSAPLTYVRHAIEIDRIEGDKAFLAKGLNPGAKVVTVGATELYGSEMEFEEE